MADEASRISESELAGSTLGVWGSDWPHTPLHDAEGGPDVAVPYRDLAYSDVVDGFLAALASSERAERIMAANPARLYELPDARRAAGPVTRSFERL